jgi:hypothetical protein
MCTLSFSWLIVGKHAQARAGLKVNGDVSGLIHKAEIQLRKLQPGKAIGIDELQAALDKAIAGRYAGASA